MRPRDREKMKEREEKKLDCRFARATTTFYFETGCMQPAPPLSPLSSKIDRGEGVVCEVQKEANTAEQNHTA